LCRHWKFKRIKVCRTVHPKYLIVVHLKLRKTAREGETSFVICFKDLKLFIYRRCLDWRQLQIDSIKAHISGSSKRNRPKARQYENPRIQLLGLLEDSSTLASLNQSAESIRLIGRAGSNYLNPSTNPSCSQNFNYTMLPDRF
jgi:hypothetical protein